MSAQNVVPWLIASGDEGLQVSESVRFAFVGSGYQLSGFDQALAALRAQLPAGGTLLLASMQEDDWLAEQLDSKNPNLYQEKLSAFASQHQLTYAGQFDYGDPRLIGETVVRGHLVRPPKVHVADEICVTVGGGEQTYNLRQFVISADYLHALDAATAAAIITPQLEFYAQLIGHQPRVEIAREGPWPDALKQANCQRLQAILAAWR